MHKKLCLFMYLTAIQLQASSCENPCDIGPNDYLPAPVLSSASNNNGTITVSGSFKSRHHRDSKLIIQFFGNPSNRSGVTEGQDFLGQTEIHTGCTGRAKFTVTLPPTQINDPYMSATATLLENDECHRHGKFFSKPLDTSMFSANIAIG